MAKVLAHRPRYRARMSVIYYLHGDQLLLRKRPTLIRDPRTPAQRRQRLRMRVASHFLAGFRDIVSLGFSPELQENFRQVGAYQRALGHLMRNALTALGEGVTIAPERVLLAPSASSSPRALTTPWGGSPSTPGGACCASAGMAACRPAAACSWWGSGTGARAGRSRGRSATTRVTGLSPSRSRRAGRATRSTCGWRPGARESGGATPPRTPRSRARRGHSPSRAGGWTTSRPRPCGGGSPSAGGGGCGP